MTASPPPPSSATAPSSPPSGGSAREKGLLVWLERRLNLTEIFSLATHFGFIYTPIDTTQPFRDVLRRLARERVPAYARWPRVLGLFAAVLFGIEAVTGLLLAFYYRPTAEAAFASTRTIMRDIPFGWLLHQMHVWGAYLLALVLLVRLLRLFWDGLFRAPREILWWSGLLLAWVAFAADATGRLLVWDERTYWATVRGLEVVYTLPLLGPIAAFLLGGHIVNDEVVLRGYVFHVMVVPVVFSALLYLTFATLRRVGLSEESAVPLGRETTYRDHIYALVSMLVVLFGVLVSLAVLVPFQLRSAADPYATPAGAHPAWYLLAPYAITHISHAGWLGGLVTLVAAVATFLLPVLARARRGPARLALTRLWGGLAILAWAALTVLGLGIDRR